MGDPILATVGDDIKLWDTNNWSQIRHFNPHNNNVSAISWSFDGNLFGTVCAKDDKISLNYLANGTITTTELACQVGQSCLDISSNSKYVVTGSSNNVVSIWNVKTRKLKTSHAVHSGPISCTLFNWNDSYIASGSENGEIILYNCVTGQSSSPLIHTKYTSINQLQYNCYKKSLLGSASNDGSVDLWDTNTRRLIHSFKAHTAPSTGLTFSPVNEMFMLSVGLDQKLICYDFDRKRVLKTYETDDLLTSVDMMHNGSTVAVGTTRGKVVLYDLRKAGGPVKCFVGHKLSVKGIRFRPNKPYKKSDGQDSALSRHRQLPSAPIRNVDLGTEQNAHEFEHAMVDKISPSRKDILLNDDSGIRSARLQQNNLTGQDTQSTMSDFWNSRLSQNGNRNSDHCATSQNENSVKLDSWMSQNSISDDKKVSNGLSGFASPTRHLSPKGVSASPSRSSVSTRKTGADGAVGEVTDYNRAAFLELESPPRQSGSRADHRQVSPSMKGLASYQELRNLVKETVQECSEQRQEEMKAMFRQSLQSPKQDANTSISEARIFQTEFIRNIIHDEVEEFSEKIHKDILHLHVQMLREFLNQQSEIMAMMEKYSVNWALVSEVERLREENKRLKKTF